MDITYRPQPSEKWAKEKKSTATFTKNHQDI